MNCPRKLEAPSFAMLALVLSAVMLSGCGEVQNQSTAHDRDDATSTCDLESLPDLPDVKLTSATQESAPVPHCKVAGVIGSEIHFELLLPEKWNGKFVFGGGGGFVGSVVNVAASLYGAVQSGYATVGTDTGHQAHSLDASWALNNMERGSFEDRIALLREMLELQLFEEAV